MKKIGIALGSGGAKGLAHIAFLKALDDLNIKPTIMSGSSIGAAFGAFYAAGLKGADIEYFYKEMSRIEIAKLLDFSFRRKSGFIKGNKLMNWFNVRMPCKDFKQLKIPLKVMATDYWKRSPVILDKGNISNAVRASIAIPGLFQPKTIRSRVLVDGGVYNPLPYEIIKKNCDKVIAIDVCGSYKPIHDHVPSVVESLVSTYQSMYTSLISTKLQLSKPDIYVKVNLSNIGFMDFHKIDEVFKGVKREVNKFKRELKRL